MSLLRYSTKSIGLATDYALDDSGKISGKRNSQLTRTLGMELRAPERPRFVADGLDLAGGGGGENVEISQKRFVANHVLVVRFETVERLPHTFEEVVGFKDPHLLYGLDHGPGDYGCAPGQGQRLVPPADAQ